jgi:hypothetical protein
VSQLCRSLWIGQIHLGSIRQLTTPQLTLPLSLGGLLDSRELLNTKNSGRHFFKKILADLASKLANDQRLPEKETTIPMEMAAADDCFQKILGESKGDQSNGAK